MSTFARALAASAVVPLLFSFSGSGPDRPELPKSERGNFMAIPDGLVRLDEERLQVKGFALSPTEVSNAQYREFVAHVRASGDMALLAVALPDTAQWLSTIAYQEPYRVYYFSHPAYANYPVVNVSHAAAEAYCAWKQERMNVQAPAGVSYEVRLPDRTEWVRAANGNHEQFLYAWGGPYLRNAKGCTLCNYRRVGDENVRRDPVSGKIEVVDGKDVAAPYMGVAGAVIDNADITAPVNSYFPNDFGLYNMNGNVAEMLQEPGQAAGGSWRSTGYDVRNESLMPFTGPSPEVGFRIAVVVKRT